MYFLYCWCFEQNYIEFTTPDEMEKFSRKNGKDTRDLAYALTLSLTATLRHRISGMKNRNDAFNTTWNIMCIPGSHIVIWEQQSFHPHSAVHEISSETNPCVLGLFGQRSLLYYFVTWSRRFRLSKQIFFLKKRKFQPEKLPRSSSKFLVSAILAIRSLPGSPGSSDLSTAKKTFLKAWPQYAGLLPTLFRRLDN